MKAAAQDHQSYQSQERADSEPAAVEAVVESTSDDTQDAGESSSNEEEVFICKYTFSKTLACHKD